MAEERMQSPETHSRLYSIEYDNRDGLQTALHGEPIIDLYRSLTIGGIVAYVGSGNSMMFGYGNWDELSKRMLHLAAREWNRLDLADPLRSAFGLVAAMTEEEARGYEIGISDRLALAEEMLRQSSEIGDVERDYTLRRMFEFPSTRSADFAEKVLERLIGNESFSECAGNLLGWVKALGNHANVPIDCVPGIKLAACITGFMDDVIGEKEVSAKIQFLDTPAPTIDVLTTLRIDWRISRFATLNYDYEIERMLERTGFPFESITPKSNRWQFAPEVLQEEADRGYKLTTRSLLGEKARSVDLNHSNVGEFMLFAADAPVGVSRVLHLHGSMRYPSQMIVTDTDYNRRYFVDEPWNEILKDSQNLLYRANAIVFIGVGMSEEVLLQAMRTVSQTSEREARPAYAFLMSRNEIKDASEAIKYFRRYGIRTIFYGTRLGSASNPEAGDFHLHPLAQAAFRQLHPDMVDRNDAESDKKRKEVAAGLEPLSVELSCLEAIETALKEIKSKREPKKCLAKIGTELAKLERGLKEKLAAHDEATPVEDRFTIKSLPRLNLTAWHCDVFRLVWATLHAQRDGISVLSDDSILKALIEAVSSLSSAIHSRALLDALQAISAKSVQWRKSWKHRPLRTHSRADLGWWHFRDPANVRFDLCGGRVCSHNISRPHPIDSGNRASLSSILKDESGNMLLDDAAVRISQHPVVVARAPNGSGKGMLAARFMKKGCRAEDGRLVLSFGPSFEHDAMFDLIAYWHPAYPAKRAYDWPTKMEYIVSHIDIAISSSEGRPKLAEWDAFFRASIAHEGTRWLLLCENIETFDYFMSLDAGRHKLADSAAKGELAAVTNGKPFHKWLIDHIDLFRSEGPRPMPGTSIDDGNARRLWEIWHIATICSSVWVASFLTSVYTEIISESANSAASSRSHVDGDWAFMRAARFDDILRRVKNMLDITYDPHHRVPNLIDVVIAQMEIHVLRHRDLNARIIKIISNAILKHLFAFGGAVDRSVFARCPEFIEISRDYDDKIKTHEQLQQEIEKAMGWLRGLDLVTELTDCYSRPGPADRFDGSIRVRHGLHAHVRNWLATKKGLPFSVVVGREQTAITVIPVIDDEIVPLDREDYKFIWDTVDGLLEPLEDGSAAPHPQVRAAYMLLRGSMRIGSVLRSAHGSDPEDIPGRTTLDDYLRRLLDLRHAALRCAARDPDDGEPLFEREWVWLFNELGVVKLLQGHAHDASALFEQAIEFETKRLRAGVGFERMIYADYGLPDFSVTKLRIMMNLALAEIERGAFNRAGRILASEKRDINELIELFSDRSGRVPESRRVHREIRILDLVLGLVDTRLKFLCGGAGEAMHWLETNGKRIVGEGVHGLTALYYLIRADVESGRRNYATAAELFATARAEAEASGRSDLIFGVMLGESELRMAMQRQPGAGQLQQQLARIRKINHEAERLGMSRIVVTACMLHARLYMGFGEFRSARQDLMTALTKATNCGLHLKRTSALIDMAALVGALDASLRDEARDIARSARFDAERMGYKLAAARAKDLELVLREQGSIEDWLFRAGAEKNGVRDEGG